MIDDNNDIHEDDTDDFYLIDYDPTIEELAGMMEIVEMVGDENLPRILEVLHKVAHNAIFGVGQQLLHHPRDHTLKTAHEVHGTIKGPEGLSSFEEGVGIGLSIAYSFYTQMVADDFPLDIDFDHFAEVVRSKIAGIGETRQ